ncbi:CinA family protein [Legionella fairfieldensis]|uniref:CinA family protein n=1 Tax=Legionella fairfieldensis TaxID=45064 RepID=UPI0004916399|nr:CinA family protein [Legionella fairfieldensis]
MNEIKQVLSYLKEKNLVLTTAESCTAGRIIHLLAKIPGSGACLEAGFVVYSIQAKKRLLKVKQSTIDQYTLTSEEVAREMVEGTLKYSTASVIVATTGVAGPGPENGIPQGTVCFGWGFNISQPLIVFSETKKFSGSRSKVLTQAATYALVQIPKLHQHLIRG